MDDLVSRLVPLEQEINRLEHYVALLEPRQAAVIRLFFFEGRSIPEICSEMRFTAKTMRAVRQQAIDELAEMYAFASELL